MTHRDWEELATSAMFGGHFDGARYGLELKPNRTLADVSIAVRRAFATPPYKTEFHILAMVRLLKKLTRPIPEKTEAA